MILGFEFKTNTEPFAVYSLINSFSTCLVMVIESEVTNLAAFRWYFVGACCIAIGSQLVIITIFKFKYVKETEKSQDNRINNASTLDLELDESDRTSMNLLS
jgi:hypothetical protein